MSRIRQRSEEYEKKLRALECDIDRLRTRLSESEKRLAMYKSIWKAGKGEIQTSRGQAVTVQRGKSLENAARLEKGFAQWLRMMIGRCKSFEGEKK